MPDNDFEFLDALNSENWTETKSLHIPGMVITLRQNGGVIFQGTSFQKEFSSSDTVALAMFLRDNIQIPERPTAESVLEVFKNFKPTKVEE